MSLSALTSDKSAAWPGWALAMGVYSGIYTGRLRVYPRYIARVASGWHWASVITESCAQAPAPLPLNAKPDAKAQSAEVAEPVDDSGLVHAEPQC